MNATPDSAPPSVLVLSGNDPSGGAGIAADIQAITAMAAHPAPVITTLTVQDTVNATEVASVDAALVVRQAQAVLADLDVAAIKIGLLGSVEVATAVAGLLDEHADLPVVLDPVLVAAGGARLAEAELADVLLDRLLPLTTVLTPNTPELHALVDRGSDEERAAELVGRGAQWVLVKGADADTPEVHNVLHGRGGEVEILTWSRLPGTYHGSGCTLAAAIAALLARGEDVIDAVGAAQRYTWEALRRGFRPGKGQRIPNRFLRLPSGAHK